MPHARAAEAVGLAEMVHARACRHERCVRQIEAATVVVFTEGVVKDLVAQGWAPELLSEQVPHSGHRLAAGDASW